MTCVKMSLSTRSCKFIWVHQNIYMNCLFVDFVWEVRTSWVEGVWNRCRKSIRIEKMIIIVWRCRHTVGTTPCSVLTKRLIQTVYINKIWNSLVKRVKENSRFPLGFGILLGSMLSSLRSVSQLGLRRSHRFLVSFSTSESELRIRCHIENIKDLSIPYVLIESSFLARCGLVLRLWYLVWKPNACIRAMHFIEKSIRKQGAVPISLGMLDGDVCYMWLCIINS